MDGGESGVKAPTDGAGVGTDRGGATSGCQFHTPPALPCRSYACTSRPASRRCRTAVAPAAPTPTRATLRMGRSKEKYSVCVIVIVAVVVELVSMQLPSP